MDPLALLTGGWFTSPNSSSRTTIVRDRESFSEMVMRMKKMAIDAEMKGFGSVCTEEMTSATDAVWLPLPDFRKLIESYEKIQAEEAEKGKR